MASREAGKKEVIKWIKTHLQQGDTCLDVGACDGKWHYLLGNYLKMDAVEAFEPNIEKHHLENLYEQVFACDVYDLEYDYYDCIIFGDVIEHMTVERAQYVLDYAKDRCKYMIVAVPYEYEQDELYGNKYEIHIQDDLTHKNFLERYGKYDVIWSDEFYAYYVNKDGRSDIDLTIVIPCHDSYMTISPLLASLAQQKTYKYNLELLFVNDTPDKKLNELIYKYFDELPHFVRIFDLTTDNHSKFPKFNYGSIYAMGKYIWFMNSDNWLVDDLAITKFLQLLDRSETNVVNFSYQHPPFFKDKENKKILNSYVFNRKYILDLSFGFDEDADTKFIEEVIKRTQKNDEMYYILNEEFIYYNYESPYSCLVEND